MNRAGRSAHAAEVHVHIGHLVIDAQALGDAGTRGFEAALQAALGERLGAARTPAGAAPRGMAAGDSVAEAVAAHVNPKLGPAGAG
jgi:hypothetical protein